MKLIAGVEVEVFGVAGTFLAADYNQEGDMVMTVRVTLSNRRLVEEKAALKGVVVDMLSDTILQVPGAAVLAKFSGAGAGDSAMLEGVTNSLARIQRGLAFRSKISA
ncbi:hypothetical protein BKN49_06190 [Pseudomonas aeruginosa]|jgi:hypothetical protein|nr:hypothetical protein BKN49_06190 [Pseudomonas aeruginosa]